MDAETVAASAATAQAATSSPALAIALVAVGALAVIGAAAYIYIKRMPGKPFSRLQDTQQTLDTLDTPALVAWAREAELKPGTERMVVKANRKWVSKLGYKFPRELSPENNVIACVVDKISGEVTHERLFSFSEMSEKVQALFGAEDCFFLRD